MSTKRLSAVIEIGGAVANSLKGSITGTTKKIGDLSSSIKKLGATQDKIKAAHSLEKSLKADAAAMAKLQEKANRLALQFAATGYADKKLEAMLQQTEKEASKLGRQFDGNRVKLGKFKTELSKAGINVHRFADEEARLGRILDKNKRKLAAREGGKAKMSSLQEKGGELGTALIGPAAVLGAAMVSTNAAKEYEVELTNIEKSVGGSAAQVKKLGDAMRDLAMTAPVTRTEVMEIGAMAGQAGVARDELVEYTKDIIKLKVGFRMTAEEANDTFQALRAGMALSNKDAMKLANTISVYANKFQGVVSEKTLGEFIQRQGATLKGNGLKTGQVAALGAAMLAPGTGTELAATAAKNMTNALTRGEASKKGQRWALKLIGLDPVNLSKQMQKDAPGAIINTMKRIAAQPKFKQSAIVSKLFGEESKGGIMPLLINIPMLENAFRSLNAAEADTNTLTGIYEKQLKTTAANQGIFTNTIQDTNVAIGSGLNQSLGQAMTKLQPLNKGLNDFARNHPGTLKFITDFAVGTALATAGMISFRLAIVGTQIAATALGISLGLPTIAVLAFAGALAAVVLNWDKIEKLRKDPNFKVPAMAGAAGVMGTGMGDAALAEDKRQWDAAHPANYYPSVKGKAAPMGTYTDNSQFTVVIHPAGIFDAEAMKKVVAEQYNKAKAEKRRKALHDGGR